MTLENYYTIMERRKCFNQIILRTKMETLHVSVVHFELVPFSIFLLSCVVRLFFSVTLQFCGGLFKPQSVDEEIVNSL